MPITFDPAKSQKNLAERDLSFDAAADFAFDTAIVRQDRRFAYPERRFQAIGKIGRRTVMLVYTPTTDGFRVISLRAASRKERKLWLASQP